MYILSIKYHFALDITCNNSSNYALITIMILSPYQVDTISGVSAGVVSTILTHPLDLLKIRLQVSNISLMTIFAHLQANNSFIKLIYQGLVPNLIGNTVGWSLYFTLYETLKTIDKDHVLRDNAGNTNTITSSRRSLSFFTASTISGLVTSILTNPIWFLKTRLMAENNLYTSLTQTIVHINRTEGIQTFWKGCVPSLFPVFQNSLQFTIYDQLKHYNITGEEQQHWLNYLVLSSVLKVSSMLVMYPFQVIRSNLQKVNAENLWIEMNHLWKQRRLYRGFGISLIKAVPNTLILFVTYETTKKYLTRLENYEEVKGINWDQ